MTGHSGAAVLDRPMASPSSAWGRRPPLHCDMLSIAMPARASMFVVVYGGATIKDSVAAPKSAGVLRADEMVAQLRNGGLPVAAVAEILKVERKTVYAWLGGTYPHQANAARIETLYALLGDGKVDLRNFYRVWNRKLEHLGSVHDLLTADYLDEPAIRSALEVLRPAIARHAEHAASRRPSAPGSGYPVIDEMPGAAFPRED